MGRLRHRTRNYKRRIRNLVLEVTFITILVFVATKFIKKDEEKPHVKDFSIEEQKNVIKEEMNTTVKEDNTVKPSDTTREIELPEELYNNLKIVKVTLSYIEETKLTLVNFDIKNLGMSKAEENIPINFVDENGNILEQTYISVQNINTNQQTRLNMVVNADLRETKKVEIRKEVIE